MKQFVSSAEEWQCHLPLRPTARYNQNLLENGDKYQQKNEYCISIRQSTYENSSLNEEIIIVRHQDNSYGASSI